MYSVNLLLMVFINIIIWCLPLVTRKDNTDLGLAFLLNSSQKMAVVRDPKDEALSTI